MAWQTIGRKRYYTRSRKVKGRVVRESFGSGPEAHLAAALDARRRHEREASWTARRLERACWRSAVGTLERMIGSTQLLLRAALLTAGYHQHERGAWRRRHDANQA